MLKVKWLVYLVVMTLFVVSCQKQDRLQNGVWRGELAVADNKKAPFLFEVSAAGTDTASVTLVNGVERVKLDSVRLQSDTLIIPIAAYDAYIEGIVSGDTIEGKFIKNYIENDPGIPFHATFGVKERFKPVETISDIRIDGKWDVLFISEKDDTSRNVGVFKSENNNIVTGSILTNSGDLRFLEGAYTESGVNLSAFGGLSPYLLEIRFSNDSVFNGKFYTTRGVTGIVGTRNDYAELADPYSLANLKPEFSSLGFNLPNLEGENISLNDERYRGKVVIISILGSWCPNCLDEMEFLAPWYDENKERGVEVIGIAFERKNDFDYAKTALTRLKNRYGANYEILFGGEVGRESVANALPEVDNFSSYPTTLFIDKKGVVRKIHTGFNGPATGLFYEEFKRDFNSLINSLLSE
ncbi:TlpA disulfide reductase family protein [Proteiniphilum sp.]|uniref:TlpA disulfide reductase family protein n=1 Tax=Proteiniphilum sp. TaxID=1926877 RepID=UPI002B2037B7|nr:TlpA disulfide reductase family protein [Proteiniphilum sp.]MEA4919088.1 TlpA disulfide reductase family protein [Proteiniphilum sp.]